ncbi:hypothetical protein ACFSQ0_11685 [Mesonia sediminis]|uniref:Uncharacterized protein n=1 Tax=Mesonia sediminis TaxID=1703946 RepID=A0ABW5SG25_9FLAO
MQNYTNKEIPLSIKDQVEVALSHYPQLKDTPIAFRFKKEIKKSTMQAQPSFASFLKSRKNRAYIIFISEKFHIEDEEFSILDVEDDVLIGWIGHELGHVMDYRDRGTLGMAVFGLKYLFSTAHIQEVERTADTYAIKHGMKDYILATKNFILNNADLSPAYKARIKNLYMSPEEIMELVNELGADKLEQEVAKKVIQKRAL